MITPMATMAAGTARNTAVCCSWRTRLFDRLFFEPGLATETSSVTPRAAGRPTRGITFSSVIVSAADARPNYETLIPSCLR